MTENGQTKIKPKPMTIPQLNAAKKQIAERADAMRRAARTKCLRRKRELSIEKQQLSSASDSLIIRELMEKGAEQRNKIKNRIDELCAKIDARCTAAAKQIIEEFEEFIEEHKLKFVGRDNLLYKERPMIYSDGYEKALPECSDISSWLHKLVQQLWSERSLTHPEELERMEARSASIDEELNGLELLEAESIEAVDIWELQTLDELTAAALPDHAAQIVNRFQQQIQTQSAQLQITAGDQLSHLRE